MKLFSLQKSDLYAAAIILLTSILTVADLFITPGRPANMDGIVHTVTPNLFYLALRQGEFPITWIDGFANYGLPLGIIAHQTTTYSTAFLQFLVGDPVIAFNILAFFGFFLSFLFFYLFLRIYFLPIYAFAGAFIFNFAPYRILNIYIRGAMPEFFAGIFIPLLLISLHMIIQKKNYNGFLLLILTVCAITLTHPFILIISLFLAVPYLIFLLLTNGYMDRKSSLQATISLLSASLVSSLIGIGIGGYFIFPLLLENKYFYYGLTKNHLTPGNYFGLQNFFDPKWYYFTEINILPRGFFVSAGSIESFIFLIGFVALLYVYLTKKQNKNFPVLLFSILCGIFILFFTLEYSDVFYKNISVLSGIQFPWRLLTAFVFIPPLIAAYLLSRIQKGWVVLLFILLLCILRFPQLYGKNYVDYPLSAYSFTPLNLHATVMNPIWTGRSEDYPIESEKAAIIEGKGTIKKDLAKNSFRSYTVIADTPVRLVDYTFYFPGWSMYIDGAKSEIEYQDPKYRGVITYRVPKGQHAVLLRFEDTRVRIAGKILSIVAALIFVLMILFRQKIRSIIYRE